MSQKLKGNTRGLAPSQIKLIERLFRRKLDPEDLVPLDLARELCEAAQAVGRRIGILVSREGRIEELFVGDKQILYLPDLGRYRLGSGRLRRLRLIFSDLAKGDVDAVLPRDIITDLEKLRLDAVVGVKNHRNRVSMAWAHLSSGMRSEVAAFSDLGRFEIDFKSFIDELESNLDGEKPEYSGKQSAVLVHVSTRSKLEVEASLAELEELCRSAGLQVVLKLVQRKNPDPRSVLGAGKLEEVVLEALRVDGELLIFDLELKPTQWRVVTNATELKVLDRPMVILDIFSQRAKSSEGALQVELAQLKYNLPRLVERDSGLSRLSGGIGGRGPGETKLEISRRRSRDRIAMLEEKITGLGKQRGLRREGRLMSELPLVAIVGYTNVGKSTLFNALTGSSVIVEDKVFATLDPYQRRVNFPKGNGFVKALVADTVGFIRDLPEDLISAFRSTLEELRYAKLLIHLLDASDPQVRERKKSVDAILKSMELEHIQQIVVLNKCDKVSDAEVSELASEFEALTVSALDQRSVKNLARDVGAFLVESEVAEALMDADDADDAESEELRS